MPRIPRLRWPEVTGLICLALLLLLYFDGDNLAGNLPRAAPGDFFTIWELVFWVAKPLLLILTILLLIIVGPFVRLYPRPQSNPERKGPVDGVIYTGSELEDFKRRGLM